MSTVKIVFALVDLSPGVKKNLAPPVSPDLKPGPVKGPASRWYLAAEALKGTKEWVELLNPKPNTKQITISGKYSRGIKPYTIWEAIAVRYEGNDQSPKTPAGEPSLEK
jgi:hypothetical protein